MHFTCDCNIIIKYAELSHKTHTQNDFLWDLLVYNVECTKQAKNLELEFPIIPNQVCLSVTNNSEGIAILSVKLFPIPWIPWVPLVPVAASLACSASHRRRRRLLHIHR